MGGGQVAGWGVGGWKENVYVTPENGPSGFTYFRAAATIGSDQIRLQFTTQTQSSGTTDPT